MEPDIVGAGLAGLIAAQAFPRSPIFEQMPEPAEMHKALLRFRTDKVAQLVGIEFKPVTVHKGIWMDGGYQAPNIQLANLYSRKVIGSLLDRSIWRLDPVTRWVAPLDLYERLLTAAQERVHWAASYLYEGQRTAISTAPLPVVLTACGLDHPVEFKHAAISVARFTVPGADVYQTVYFPSESHSLYRASITGNTLICEFNSKHYADDDELWQMELSHAFALDGDIIQTDAISQRYGKIAPIDENIRKNMINHLTREFDIFSLGRFATWRNILLDDVVHDIAVIKQLLTASQYDRRIAAL